MAKAMIYTVNGTSVTLTAGSVIPLGRTIRRFGCGVAQIDDGILLKGTGYYRVSVSANIAPTAAGVAGVEILMNGVPVTGGIAETQTATAGQERNLATEAVVRVTCPCMNDELTFRVTADSTVATINVIVEKM